MPLFKYRAGPKIEKKDQTKPKNSFIKKHLSFHNTNFSKEVKTEAEK